MIPLCSVLFSGVEVRDHRLLGQREQHQINALPHYALDFVTLRVTYFGPPFLIFQTIPTVQGHCEAE